MTNPKKPTFGPKVEVIRRPAGGQPSTPAPTPAVKPQPVAAPTPAPAPRPAATAAVPTSAPRPASPNGGPPRSGSFGGPGAGRSFGGGPRGPGGPGGPGMRRPRGPITPPTLEQIEALAKKERVPARIAKGDLEGKMKCRIWRKLHAEEAKRFDQAYTLMEKHPELDLQDAFGVVQSGKTPAEFLAKKARGKLKADIKEARHSLPGDAVDTWLKAFIESKEEVAFTLGDRTVVDRLLENQPVAFVLERAGRLEKLQVVLICRREQWEKLNPTLVREPKLSRKPIAVQRQPDRRPVADPRAFQPQLGQKVTVELRNGITLTDTLKAIGPFDILIGADGQEIFVPLHAMLKWNPGDPSPAGQPPA